MLKLVESDSSGMQNSLSLTPLGAGDLIDRAVRFYRKNFWTFILIAAPPVLVGTLFSIGWTMLAREMFSPEQTRDEFEGGVYFLYMWFGSLLIFLTESVVLLVVMGGASRNFVRHLLFGEPISFKETYRNTRKRLGGLIVASLFIAILLGVVGYFILSIGLVFGFILVGFAVYAFSFSPFLAFIVGLVLGIAVTFGTLWLFFLLASRFAYVPQVMLVEGQGVFAAIGRSTSLASGNVKRFAALFIFTAVAAYSALALFYVPLMLYAWSNGVNIFSLDADMVPASYEIAKQFISQASFILLSPIWTVGLCLLYVDERVRHEGYDIELMAARRLGEIPAVPQDFINPLQPALANQNAPAAPVNQTQKSPYSTLGLK
jgi:hypothetical protein